MQEGSTGGGEERKPFNCSLGKNLQSEQQLPLLLTCCKAARPQGSLDSCSDSSKWPECTEELIATQKLQFEPP